MTEHRFTFRTKLALLVGGLLLFSGTLLLGLNYVLVQAALPAMDKDSQLVVASSTPNGPETGTLSDDGAPTSDPVASAKLINASDYQRDVLRTILLESGVTLIVSAGVALLLGWVAARRMLRPVRAVSSAARRLGADNLDRRIGMTGPRDELTELADTFDDMLDRLAHSFDSQKRFVANASHELRTPLAAQRTIMEVALARPRQTDATRDLCTRLLTMNARSEALIEGLLVLAGTDRGLETRRDVRLDEVTRQVVAAHTLDAELNGVTLTYETRPWTVRGAAVLLERLVTNLVANGLAHNAEGGFVHVTAGPVLTVANSGPEIPADAVPSLFEPFVRLPRSRVGGDRGAGLGLSIVASIVRAHDGVVTATPRDGGGLVVRVEFP